MYVVFIFCVVLLTTWCRLPTDISYMWFGELKEERASCGLWAVAITLHAAKPSLVDVGVSQPYTKTVVADRDMLHKPQAEPSPPLVAEDLRSSLCSIWCHASLNGCQIFQAELQGLNEKFFTYLSPWSYIHLYPSSHIYIYIYPSSFRYRIPNNPNSRCRPSEWSIWTTIHTLRI